MKNNYPIKYAVMPIYEQVGWNHGLNELEREYDIVAYIVSKCFIISETKKYKIDGSLKKEYQVVFPYRNDEYDIWIRTEPRFGFQRQVMNTIIVNDVYESYEDALEDAKSKNEKIKEKKISLLNIDNNLFKEIDKIKIEHEELIKKYEDLQKQIEKNTTDLKIDEISKEQSLIITIGEKNTTINMYEDKMINISLYDYINLFRNEKFEVISVSLEEYELMKKQLNEREKLEQSFLETLTSKKILLINLKESEIIQIVDSDKSDFYLNDDRYLVYKENMNVNRIEGEHIIVYTIETYEDILKSFITKYKSDKNIKIEGKTIRKKLTLK